MGAATEDAGPPRGMEPEGRRYVLIDFDGTLVKDIFDHMSWEMTLHRFPSVTRYLRACVFILFYAVSFLVRWMGVPRSRSTSSRFISELWVRLVLAGVAEEEMDKYAQECVPRFRRALHKNVHSKVMALQAEGYEVYVVTGNFGQLVGPYIKELGFKCISSQLEIQGGRLTGRVVGGVNFGSRKVENALRVIGGAGAAHHTVGFGNDHNDIELLCSVDEAIAVRPCKELAGECAARGWTVIREVEVAGGEEG